MRRVEFFYSIGSRYSYLAATQISGLEEQTGCDIEWLPVNSVALLKRRGTDPFSGVPVSGQYSWTYRELDATRWAALYGVPFREPRGRVRFDSELLAMAAMTAKRLGIAVPFTRSLFAALFVDDVSEIDAGECLRRAKMCGIAEDIFRAELARSELEQATTLALDHALARGVFGVPTFIVDGQLFWGNDRLVLLRAYLDASGR